ncbi:helix-turn-helix domain-containing protein [Microbacterium amylolyticum]|uniref:Transcriptional regulator with XRE-family HTH domain n=1 Tax=Microbacterium amylolyticum TaxID=936337 RepID=A0ABS4ZEW1_9MICO|nr:helix-turn-helix transcriptional regulator [Microbacterium amylolyticum]MBP2435821.1 transcriptional regulator with XRE-family HTH domain [Microbacterium amylolyticum]
MENKRLRGNPAGLTNNYVAHNVRNARQSIGMDLRTLSQKLTEAGRKLSVSGVSKVELGDRRVDVDDLTAIAYALGTTPAALLSPSEGESAFTGVPAGHTPEEVRAWLAGDTALTHAALVGYWQRQAQDALYEVETAKLKLEAYAESENAMAAFGPHYQERVERFRKRLQHVNLRLLQLDPDARPFGES